MTQILHNALQKEMFLAIMLEDIMSSLCTQFCSFKNLNEDVEVWTKVVHP